MTSKTSKIICENCYLEDIFDIAIKLVLDSCGDGWAFFVCDNPLDVLDKFKTYFLSNYIKLYNLYSQHEYECGDYIYYYQQEGFTFTKNNVELSYSGDYVFHLKNCPLGYNNVT